MSLHLMAIKFASQCHRTRTYCTPWSLSLKLILSLEVNFSFVLRNSVTIGSHLEFIFRAMSQLLLNQSLSLIKWNVHLTCCSLVP